MISCNMQSLQVGYKYVPILVLTLGAHGQLGYCNLGLCLLSHISPLECLFVLKILSRTQRATEVKNVWGFL